MPQNLEKRFKTRSVAGTLSIAQTIAEILSAPRTVILRGDLGAGKTTLVRGWAAALGARDDVSSPTFTLVHEYRGTRVKLYHLDLYRIETERELLQLGLDEMIDDRSAVVLIEWGDKFASVLARATAEVAMAHLEGDERSLHVHWEE